MNLLTMLLGTATSDAVPAVPEIYLRVGAAALRIGREEVTKKLAEYLERGGVPGQSPPAPFRARAHHLNYLLNRTTSVGASRRFAEYADRTYRELDEVPPADIVSALAEQGPDPAAAGDRGTRGRMRRVAPLDSGRSRDWVYGLDAMQEYLSDQDVPVRRADLQRALSAGDIVGARREPQGRKAWSAPRRVVLEWARARIAAAASGGTP